jgi:flagellar hook-associated protein 2
MGRITSSVGLITGIPIEDTVNQLLSLSARPRDLLIGRTEQLQEQQVAITELTASVIGIQLSIQGLRSDALFDDTTVTSSDDTVLATIVTGTPPVGTFGFTPIRRAQSHQLLSTGFADKDTALGAGDVSIRFGGFVDRGILLDELNGGAGVARGKIRITDRTGTSEVIDLRFAQTIDDVVRTINSAANIDVTASTDGDGLKLVDGTSAGQVSSNLKVQDFGLASTASDLGIGGIDTALAEASGQDIVRLYDNLQLSRLNDGNNVNFKHGVADLQVDLQDGSSLQIEFFAQTKGVTQSSGTTTAANGADAEVAFTSVGTGESFDDYTITFVDDENITVGNETVEIDTSAKTLKFSIDDGNTRAFHVINALNNDATASQHFTAANSAGGNGSGLVDVADTATTSGGAIAYANESTIGDVLNTINAADPAKLQAQINASGDGIELVDLTAGASQFSVTSLFNGSVAEDLGLTTTAVNGVITGERRYSGLNTVLLDSLGGGNGLGQLGALSLTDRSGAAANVDLSSAATLHDVIDAVNTAGIGISARVNDARNGILLEDTSGGTGNLVVANGDATNTADKLLIATNAAVARADSGSLDLRTFNETLKLDSLNRGAGIDDGSFLITDTNGQVGAINFAVSTPESVGDVIDLINGLAIGVQARINDTGDGILLLDTAGGSGDLTVADVGSGTAAADLKIDGTSVQVSINGTPTKVIDGSTTATVSLAATDTLEDLVSKINALDADVSASIFNSGSGGTPFRLTLASQITGSSGELLVDATQVGIGFQETAQAQDALVVLGSPDAEVVGALATSSTNEFDGLIDGVTVAINDTSTEEITVTVEQSSAAVVSQLKLFADQYNQLRDRIEELSFFNETDNTVGILFGSSEVLRIESALADALTSRYFGVGSIQSYEELGLRLDTKGKLEFNEQEFRDKIASDAAAVEQFFTQAELGAATKLYNAVEQLAGAENSLLVARAEALQFNINSNQQRILDFNESLEQERESLFLQFFRLEETIGRLQNNLSALSQIQVIPPLLSTNS